MARRGAQAGVVNSSILKGATKSGGTDQVLAHPERPLTPQLDLTESEAHMSISPSRPRLCTGDTSPRRTCGQSW
jgi:hypothetical protein